MSTDVANCEHKNFNEQTFEKEVAGHKFSAKTQVCKDCGAQLWDEALAAKFNAWLKTVNKVRVQFKMSSRAEDCLEKFVEKFPGSNKTIFVRAFITVYMQVLSQHGTQANDIFNSIFDSRYYKSFAEDESNRLFPTDVKPILFIDIQSWGKLFELKPNEFASEAFHLMMAMHISEDIELKEFWTKNILPQIENIVRVA
jgi:hypothetical protein